MYANHLICPMNNPFSNILLYFELEKGKKVIYVINKWLENKLLAISKLKNCLSRMLTIS